MTIRTTDIPKDELALDRLRELSAGAATGVLECRSLAKVFITRGGSATAVESFDLRTEPGEFITLLGPSGCGKTTTLRMIAGFETPTAGSIALDGVDQLQFSPERRDMSMVFQSYALFPHLTVYENVAYGLKLRRLPAKEIASEVEVALTSMDLVRYANRAPHQLSGGQQQRVALARAMVMRPKLMLFDEPLSNLDAKLRVQMRAEIRRLQQATGVTAIYVTHDQDEAMSLSDRIVVMNEGRVEQVGTPAEVYLRPATTFVADFIGQANFLETTVESITDDGAKVRALGQTLEVGRSEHMNPDGDPLLMVRPEAIVVTPVGQATEGAGTEGTVLGTVFYGSSVEYEIEVDLGVITANVASPALDTILAVGQRVRVSFPPHKAWLLSD